jgi:dolichol-phosphate mannosyltransferase
MISVILPTLKEYENLKKLIPLILSKLEPADIIIVVDADADLVEWNKIGLTDHPQIKFIQQAEVGLGAALKQGINYALSTDSEKIVTMDADLSHNVNDLLVLKSLSSDQNIVIGSRYVEAGSFEGSYYRKTVSALANGILKIIFRSGVKDLTSGYRIYGTNFLKNNRVFLESLSNHYGFQFEILLNFERVNISIVESPINFLPRKYGRTKFGFPQIIKSIFLLVKMFSNKLGVLYKTDIYEIDQSKLD